MKTLLLLFYLFLYTSAFGQDYSFYKKGFFSYVDSTGTQILVDRKKKYQYEFNRLKKIKTQFRIIWKDSSNYTLIQTLTNSKALKKYKHQISAIKILKTDGNNGYYYDCECLQATPNDEKKFLRKISKQEFYALFKTLKK